MSVRPKILIDVSVFEALKKSAEKNVTEMKNVEEKSTNETVSDENVFPGEKETELDNADPMDYVFSDWSSFALHIPLPYRKEAKKMLARIQNSNHFDLNAKGELIYDKKNTTIIFSVIFPLILRPGRITNKKAISLVHILRKSNVISTNWKKPSGPSPALPASAPPPSPPVEQSSQSAKKPPPWYKLTPEDK